MNAFAQHFAFEFRIGMRNKGQQLMNYIFPLLCYLMFGVLMGSINPLFTKTMIPAMSIFAILTGAILGLPNPLIEARDAGVFRTYKINGVPAVSVLVIPALTTMFHSLIVAVIITATAPLLFNAPLPLNWPAYALTMVLMAFACAGLGSLIGVISANSRVTVLWSQLIFLPSMMLGGLMFPISMLPSSLKRVSAMMPSSHAMQAFMGLAYGQAVEWSPAWALSILLTGGLLAFVMAVYLFNWDNQNTQRRPLALAILALVPYIAGAVLLA